MGARQVSGLFLRPVVMDLGLSREAFGTAVALSNLVWGLAQPFAGLLADRYGARPVVIGAGLLYAAGLGLAATATNGTMFTLGLGLLCGIGVGWCLITTFIFVLPAVALWMKPAAESGK